MQLTITGQNKRWNVNTLTASNKLIGDRPGGMTKADSVIVEAAVRLVTVLGLVGVQGLTQPLLEKRPPRTR